MNKQETPSSNSQPDAVTSSEREILKLEFERLYDLFQHSEDLGEKRTNLMITLTGILFAGFTALLKENNENVFENKLMFYLLLFVLLFLFLLGILTLFRMARRNLNSDEYKAGIQIIKNYFKSKNNSGEPGSDKLNLYLFFDTDRVFEKRTAWKIRGGYVEVINLINSILVGLLLYMLVSFKPLHENWSLTNSNILIISLTGVIVFWVIQNVLVENIYNKWWKKNRSRLESKNVKILG
jgi:hypothetical protein